MKLRLILFSLLTSVGVVLPVNAAVQYWDSNGSIAGAGITPAGTWGTSLFWNPTADGTTTTPGPWVSGDDAVFSAGSDATGPFTVTLSGTQTAKSILIEEGQITFAGTGAAAITTNSITLSPGTKLSIDTSARLSAFSNA